MSEKRTGSEKSDVDGKEAAGALPRYRRHNGTAGQGLPGLLLQPRDMAILDDVWRYRWLTTSQIERIRNCDKVDNLRFVSRLPLTRRLKLLFHHRYLRRIARPIEKGSQEPVYMLDIEGAKALRRLGSAGEESISARAPSQLPRASALEHLLAVNEFRTSLLAACSDSRTGGSSITELVNWLASDAVKFSVPLQESGERERQVLLVPDGFFVLRAGGQRLFYFLEVDLGTEPGKTLIDKCLAYYAYWQTGGFAGHFKLPVQVGFRVLFVAPGPRRAGTIQTAIRTLPSGQAMFWTALQEHTTTDDILMPVFTGCTGERFSVTVKKSR